MPASRVMTRIQFNAVLISTTIMLGGCGDPAVGETELVKTDTTITEFEIPPPTATLSCAWNTRAGTFGCTGSASNGVAPYTYQWQELDDFGSGSPSPYWHNGTATLSGYCIFKVSTSGRTYYKDIHFRVLDANGYVSNESHQSYVCWAANESP